MCCRNVTENFNELLTVVLGFKCLILMFTSTDEFIHELFFNLVSVLLAFLYSVNHKKWQYICGHNSGKS